MKSKKELRDLEKQKEKSSAKVGQFLLNLQTLKKQLEQEKTSTSLKNSNNSRRTTPCSHRCSSLQQQRKSKTPTSKKVNTENDVMVTAPSSVERLSPLSKERGCFGEGNCLR